MQRVSQSHHRAATNRSYKTAHSEACKYHPSSTIFALNRVKNNPLHIPSLRAEQRKKHPLKSFLARMVSEYGQRNPCTWRASLRHMIRGILFSTCGSVPPLLGIDLCLHLCVWEMPHGTLGRSLSDAYTALAYLCFFL